MENRVYINNGWKFSETYDDDMIGQGFDDTAFMDVRIPHTCKETPFHYFDESIYQMVCLYRKKMMVPRKWQGKTVLLTFEGVAHHCEVFLNGKKVGEHSCGYTAFTIDISKWLFYGEENVLSVKADTRESNNIPPFGYVIDYMTYGGIYRDVYLEVKNETCLQDIFLMADVNDREDVRLESQITIQNPQEGLAVVQSFKRKGEKEFAKLGKMDVLQEEITQKLCFKVSDVILWDVDNPVLYEVKTTLNRGDLVLDEKTITYGFRKTEFKKDGFYLNGKKLKIRGLNRHQSYPYVGYAMPKSMQRMDADILKKELGLNAVRTSHYPQAHDFIDRCDELGLLVFTEIPGWQHIGDEDWQKQAVKNTEDMVSQYRNHPSIILWGVRINESQDNDSFYEKTNAVARALDPTRQTAGVRAHKKSSFLEDVYTYNDFSHDGKAPGCEPKKKVTSDTEKAYLISEYNGHMYPTKSFDWEEHRMEHAIRHARVLEAVAANADIAGSFGWCMADYNTHKDFGSGDRICYHGVLDMFRNPKMAADIYACMQEGEIHLSLSSTMDIGEHPGCNRGSTWIFTNADSVKMYKNERFIKEYKESSGEFSHLSHGPILIDDYIGNAIEENENFKPAQAKAIKEALNATALYGLANLPKKVYLTALKMMVVYGMKPTEAVGLYNKYIGDWGGTSTVYRFEALKDGKVVKTVTKKPMEKVCIRAYADHTTLVEDKSYDVAAVRIVAEDEFGNVLPFYQEPVCFRVKGPLEIVGPSIISLKGGMGGTYLKTMGSKGEAEFIITDEEGTNISIPFLIDIDTCKEL